MTGEDPGVPNAVIVPAPLLRLVDDVLAEIGAFLRDTFGDPPAARSLGKVRDRLAPFLTVSAPHEPRSLLGRLAARRDPLHVRVLRLVGDARRGESGASAPASAWMKDDGRVFLDLPAGCDADRVLAVLGNVGYPVEQVDETTCIVGERERDG